MNNLGLYIREALGERQEISVPGLGVFAKERTPAYFDAPQNKFMPPSSHITVREELTKDDSFVNFIAERENMTIDAARSELEKVLDVFHFDLGRHRDVMLEGFGILSRKDGKLVFDRLASDNKLEAFEPVAEAQILGLLGTEEEVLVEEAVIGDPIEESVLQVTEPSSTRRRLWPAIAVAICVLLAGFWFLRASLQQPINDPIIEEKVAITPVVATPDTIESEDSTTIVSEEIVPQVADEPQESFEIIIAAFNTMKEAQEYVARTNAKGHQVYILKNNRPSNLNKISYSSFKTEKEATLALAKVRKELASEAWIYKRKKNNNQ